MWFLPRPRCCCCVACSHPHWKPQHSIQMDPHAKRRLIRKTVRLQTSLLTNICLWHSYTLPVLEVLFCGTWTYCSLLNARHQQALSYYKCIILYLFEGKHCLFYIPCFCSKQPGSKTIYEALLWN